MRAIALAVVLVGCQPQAYVEVSCVPAGEAFNCTLKETKGAAATACWKVAVGCRNGGKIVAPACQDVGANATVTRTIPASDWQGRDTCDEAQSVALEAIEVKPQASRKP